MEKYMLYDDMLNNVNLLIGGNAGSGKSVILNGLIYTAISRNEYVVLIDPKRVDLVKWKMCRNCICYACEKETIYQTLVQVLNIIESRYKTMNKKHLEKYTGPRLYIIIDELADLLTTDKKRIEPLIMRICQICRAANVCMIAATQSVHSSILPTKIKINMVGRIGLHVDSPIQSRMMIDQKGCENLPRYGKALYKNMDCIQLVSIPMIPDRELMELIKTNKRRFLFI